MSLGIFYWAVAFKQHDRGGDANDTFTGLAVMTIISVVAYTGLRGYFNHTAGAYMVKRIVYAIVLGVSYDQLALVVVLILF